MRSERSPPRLSFSHDPGQPEVGPIELKENQADSPLLDSDFEFSISSSLDHESCSADELFSNGILLPLQGKESFVSSEEIHRCEPRAVAPLPPRPCEKSKKDFNVKEVKEVNSEQKKHVSKTFWGFRRSASLNSEGKRSLLRSLPLLSRSNSTGSASNPKRTMSKEASKHNSQKQGSRPFSRSSSSSSTYEMQQKPPLKKNYGGSHNGVRISPVLNVPPPCISKRTENLFGLGSFLRDRKDTKNKK